MFEVLFPNGEEFCRVKTSILNIREVVDGYFIAFFVVVPDRLAIAPNLKIAHGHIVLGTFDFHRTIHGLVGVAFRVV